MEIQLVRRVIAGFILSGFVFVLFGCVPLHGVLHRTETWNLPEELETKLSVGDTRQKVRNILGSPLLDAKKLGMELYRKSGRDIDYDGVWMIYLPFVIPEPGQKVIAFVMVAYDEYDVVKEITTDFWLPGHSHDYWATMGEYRFVNSYGNEPETILAPPVTWEELAKQPDSMGGCTLVLLMGKCPMEEVSLDNSHIIDLSPAGGWCGIDTWEQRESNFYGVFIRKEITPGSHRLDISQKTKHGNFETIFACEPGETIYAELEVHTVDDWWYGSRLEGEISVKKSIPNNVVEMGELRSILWHRGTWYGPPISSP